MHVEQNQIKVSGAHLLYSDETVLGSLDHEPDVLEHELQEFSILFAVVDDEDACRWEHPGAGIGLSDRGGSRIDLIRSQHRDAFERTGIDRHGKGAALAVHTADRDVAPHHAGEAATDGKAEARAAKAPSHRAVGLHELVKDRFEGFLGQSDAAVGYLQRKPHFVTLARHPRPDLHTSLVGELYRVGDQVGHDLPQSSRVGEQGLGNSLVDLEVEGDALFLGLDREHGDDLGHDDMGCEAYLLEFEVSRLDLAEIEYVVDELEEMFAAAADRLEVLVAVAFVGDVASPQYFSEAEDCVHRGADLVTHVGKEFALGAIGGLGVFFCNRKLGLVLFELRDIVEADQDAPRTAARPQDRGAVYDEGSNVTLGIAQQNDVVGARLTVGHCGAPRELFGCEWRAVGVHPGKFFDPAPHQLIGALSDDLGDRQVGENDSLFFVHHQQAFGQGVEGTAHVSGHRC